MKILFLNDDLGVKQYHMACAMKDNIEDIEIHLQHINATGYSFRTALRWFPRPRAMYRLFFKNRTRMVKDLELNSYPFDSVMQFSPKRVNEFMPDVIYINSRASLQAVKKSEVKAKVVYDVEDSAVALDPSKNKKKLIDYEMKSIGDNIVDWILFGSKGEMQQWRLYYKEQYKIDKQHRVQYPYVAKRTRSKCIGDFPKYGFFDYNGAIVYIGSIMHSKSDRNLSSKFEWIMKHKIPITVFMLNDWSTSEFNRLIHLEYNNPFFNLRRRVPLYEIKSIIRGYHLGLCLSGGRFKQSLTYGMKPLEYAYAGVQPVTVGGKPVPIVNLSDGKEFGFHVESPYFLDEDYPRNLKNFDWDYHLMDSHIHEFKELEE